MTRNQRITALLNAMDINKSAYRILDSALDLACRRLMRTCPDKCPIIQRACFDSVPTRKSCAARLKAYFLRRAR